MIIAIMNERVKILLNVKNVVHDHMLSDFLHLIDTSQPIQLDPDLPTFFVK
jgi:hypothetical protein